jgi:23S rRNA (adenine2030-N6)-methyltransferase
MHDYRGAGDRHLRSTHQQPFAGEDFALNYRHAYHAGNFADVVKHVALVGILLHLRRKDTPFAVIDSHAGRGLYDLSDEAAAKTGEAKDGIGRLRGLAPPLPEALDTYLKLTVESGADFYPGSPLIAAKLLRPQDRLLAIEKHPEEAAALATTLTPFRKATVENADGYTRLLKLLPPPERRGLVLIDPPFEAIDEFQTLAQTVSGAYRRFATGVYLIWYPVKSQAAADGFCGEVLAGGMDKALRIEIAVSPSTEKLGRSGLLVLNPPYGFDGAMREILGVLSPLLGQGVVAETRLNWLAGENA